MCVYYNIMIGRDIVYHIDLDHVNSIHISALYSSCILNMLDMKPIFE